MKKSLIGILGAGKSGIACCKLALKLGYKVILSDISSDTKINIDKNKNLIIEKGIHSEKLLNCDFIIISPGIPLEIPIVREAEKNNIPIIGEIEFASWFTKSDILSITGSNGKSTTSMMLHNMLLEAGYNSFLGGNIGVAFSENLLKELKSKSKFFVHVLELSSFQIETLKKFNSKISCILNISEDHLDRYGSMNSYINAKLKIINFSDILVYDSDDLILEERMKGISNAESISDNKAPYRISNNSIYNNKTNQLMFSLNDTNFIGYHNLLNALSACTMANLYGVEDRHIIESMKKIKPLSHRLEFIKDINNIKFYNDSKSTNIKSTIKALKSFNKNIILILGGMNKGFDFSDLLLGLKSVKKIYCYGESGDKIVTQLKDSIDIEYFNDFEDCVKVAIKSAVSNDKVLLSPACASFDQFNNFEERGDFFKKIIEGFHNV